MICLTKPSGPEVWDLDGDGKRHAFSVNGRIIYTGSREECERRYIVHTRPNDREEQDEALKRMFG